jgi:hypothetical protein
VKVTDNPLVVEWPKYLACVALLPRAANVRFGSKADIGGR